LVVVVVLVVVLVFVLVPVGLVSVPEASPRLSLLLLCWLPLCNVPLLSWLLPEAPVEELLPEVEVPEPPVVPLCVPDCVRRRCCAVRRGRLGAGAVYPIAYFSFGLSHNFIFFFVLL
jgi:hypothetical protein